MEISKNIKKGDLVEIVLPTEFNISFSSLIKKAVYEGEIEEFGMNGMIVDLFLMLDDKYSPDAIIIAKFEKNKGFLRFDGNRLIFNNVFGHYTFQTHRKPIKKILSF